MLFRQFFMDAIAGALGDMDYRLADDDFYIYRPEPGLVFKLGFDVRAGGSDFSIYGGAAALSDGIELLPDGRLSVRGYDVIGYASRCGHEAFSNRNYDWEKDPAGRAVKRYTKALLKRQLDRNMELLRNCLLADMMKIESLEDHYAFKVRADGFYCGVPVPFPTIDSFYLCVGLGKFREASHMYLIMCNRRDEDVFIINEAAGIGDALIGENDVKIIEASLRAHGEGLRRALAARTERGRALCESFFV